jgi:hypothetical protein
MISSGTRTSEIEKYLKGNLIDIHESMAIGGVPISILSSTDSLSLSLVDFFLSSLDSEKLAEMHDLEFEILKRGISIKIAQVVIFALAKAKGEKP